MATRQRKDIEHGVNAYAKGLCRCDEVCRPAWNRYQRRYRRAGRKAKRGGYFANKKAAGVALELSDIGFGRLEALEAHYGKDASDIYEAFLRSPVAFQLQFETSEASR